MNNKGFTLIELIAMVVILGVLMMIAVPNMAGIIKNNKEIAATEDFNRIVNNTKTRFNTKTAKYPKNENECVVLSLSFINTNSDLKSGINGGKYLENESFVVVRKDRVEGSAYEYKYFIRLVEEFDGEKFEVPLIETNKFLKDPKSNMPNLAPTLTFDLSTVEEAALIEFIRELGVDCGKIDRIYR